MDNNCEKHSIVSLIYDATVSDRTYLEIATDWGKMSAVSNIVLKKEYKEYFE